MKKQIDKASGAAMAAGGAIAGLIFAAPFLLIEHMVKKQRAAQQEMAERAAKREAEKRRTPTKVQDGQP